MKTYVLDASALFAFLRDEPGASKVTELVKQARREHAKLIMSAVNCGEVYGTTFREFGPEKADSAIAAVRLLPLVLIDCTPQQACQAAVVKNKYKLYYVDSFAASLALEHRATLVTSDSDFRRLGHNVPVLWLRT